VSLNLAIITDAFPRLHPVIIFMQYYSFRTQMTVVDPNLEPNPQFDAPLEPPFNITRFTVQGRHHIPITNITVNLTQPIGLGSPPAMYPVPLLQIVGEDRVRFWLRVAQFSFVLVNLIPVLLFFWRRQRYSPVHDCEAHLDISPPSNLPTDPLDPGTDDPPPNDNDEFLPLPLDPLREPNPNDHWVDIDLPAPPPAEPQEPDPVPLPLPRVPRINAADPFARYNIPPSAFDNFNDWAQLLARLPIPPNNLDVNEMCVWDCLSAIIGVDGRLLYANYIASLPVVRRGAFLNGLVLYDDVHRVLTHFNIGFTVRAATAPDDDCPRQPGNRQPDAIFNPIHPPIAEGAARPTFPTMIMFIQTNPEGSYHATLRARPVANANIPLPGNGDWIGWPSILIPSVEVGEVVNIPAKAFATVYNRMAGNVTNFLSRNGPAGRFGNFVLPAVPVQEQIVNYNPTNNDGSYAHGLASDITVKPNVLNLHEFNMHDVARTIKQMAKDWQHFLRTGQGMQRSPVRLHVFHGAYGTGKSFALTAALQRANAIQQFNSSNLAFHTWDHDLREPMMQGILAAFPNMGLQPSNFMTGCMPLALPRAGTVVFDDAGKCWNSFFPLFVACNPGVTDIYVTFDATQAQGVFPEAPSISRKHPSSSQWLSTKSDYYATQVIRTAPDVTELFGFPAAPHIPGRVVHRGQIIVVSKSPAGVPLLAVSPRFTQTQNMGGQVADTFTECQGHTIYGDVCIDLGGLTATAAEAAAWTALTRATGNIYLKLGGSIPTSAIIENGWSNSQILTALLTVASVARTPYITAAIDNQHLVKSAVISHLARCLSPAAAQRLGLPRPNPVVGVRPGLSAKFREPWLNVADKPSDVYTARTHRATSSAFKSASGKAFSRHTAIQVNSHATVAEIVKHHTSLPNSAILNTERSAYKLPPDPILTAVPDPMYDINPPTDDVAREIVVLGGASSFQHIPDGAPDALHHVRADKVTDNAGMKKRIRPGHYSGHWDQTCAKRLRQLKRGFRKFFDIDAWNSQAFDDSMMEHCTDAKLASWASKRTKKALSYSVAKQNLDAPWNMVKLFPKGQYIKKKAKWRGPAFASQTISDFNLGRIFHDSPWALYMETMALKYAYDSTYLHCRASPDDLSKWYRRFWIPGSKMVACDYTSWDSGVDHVFVEFDCWLMEINHFPESEIELYRYHRYNTYSHLGNHLPRQESGDRWTWLLNSLRNAALTGAALDCPVSTPATFSGDDGNVLGDWRTTTGFSPHDWLMKPKVERGTKLEFCGLVFGGPDISYDDAVVHWRSRFGLQQGRNDVDYWRSIRDAIRESADKLGDNSVYLANARQNLHRAVDWFSLPDDLRLPEATLTTPVPDAASLISTIANAIKPPFLWLFALIIIGL
jgi:hypothetical protein